MSISSTHGNSHGQNDQNQYSESFLKLCEIEGIKPDENAIEEASKLKSVEIFMQYGFNKIESLQYFSNITELIIIQQDLRKIENLSSLKNLKSLWINENPHLEKIEGLEELTSLTDLFLYA